MSFWANALMQIVQQHPEIQQQLQEHAAQTGQPLPSWISNIGIGQRPGAIGALGGSVPQQNSVGTAVGALNAVAPAPKMSTIGSIAAFINGQRGGQQSQQLGGTANVPNAPAPAYTAPANPMNPGAPAPMPDVPIGSMATYATPNQGQQVMMRAPDGSQQMVPAEHVDHYRQRGAQVVS